VFYAEIMFGLPLSAFGITPRTLFGLIGVFMAPLIHGDILHLISNTIPLLFLGVVLFFLGCANNTDRLKAGKE